MIMIMTRIGVRISILTLCLTKATLTLTPTDRNTNRLDQHVFVADLQSPLREQMSGYLKHSFKGDATVHNALMRVAEEHPTSLRVKELFETMESFLLISKEIAFIRSTDSLYPVHGAIYAPVSNLSLY